MVSQTCQVSSKVWWGDTGIALLAGHRYRMTASGEWADASIHCGPDGYDLSRLSPWLRPGFRLVGGLRPLDTGDRWFMLLGRIGESGAAFVIGSQIERVAEISGPLFCTVNDLRVAYGNNDGAVSLTVSEIDVASG